MLSPVLSADTNWPVSLLEPTPEPEGPRLLPRAAWRLQPWDQALRQAGRPRSTETASSKRRWGRRCPPPLSAGVWQKTLAEVGGSGNPADGAPHLHERPGSPRRHREVHRNPRCYRPDRGVCWEACLALSRLSRTKTWASRSPFRLSSSCRIGSPVGSGYVRGRRV